MAHRRVKDIAYDDDEVDDYDEYDAEPQEDKARLEQATVAVREGLGDDNEATTTEQIHESLWYYYYDVEKTITYLQRQRHGQSATQTQTPKKPKAASKFDQALQQAQSEAATPDPSPDDIVHNAQQRKGTATTNTATKPQKKNGSSKLEDGVASLDLGAGQQQPAGVASSKIKSKNINIPEEYAKKPYRRSANFVVTGHVDHGKSTLMGRMLHDAGTHITQRAFARLADSAAQAGKASFSYAWLMDSTAEERARGITVDVAQTPFATAECDFVILDAPGHRDFVPNMIAGAAQADFAVLVVDASRGQFEKGLEGGGQTKEHALLIRGLGVARVVVAVNKMDNVAWEEARFAEVAGQMSAFLARVGYREGDVRCVPCAALTGENVAARAPSTVAAAADSPKDKDKGKSTAGAAALSGAADRFAWYTGPTLLEALTAFAPSEDRRAGLISKPLRLTISDVFRGGVTNPLSVSGRVDQGAVQVGDALVAMPAGEACVVKGVETGPSGGGAAGDTTKEARGGPQADYAVAGQMATLHLTEADASHLRPGDVLCPAGEPVANVGAFTARVLAFEHLVPSAVDCHRGRMHCAAAVSRLLGLVAAPGKKDAGTAAPPKRPRVVKPGQTARVRVQLDAPMPLEAGARIVLRSEGSTVAAGLVEAAEPQ